MTAAEKAMYDVTAVIDGWPGNGSNEFELIRDISRIIGAYSVERIEDAK